MKKWKKEYYLEVFPRGRDLQAEAIKKEIRELGIRGISSVKTGKIYLLNGNLGNKSGQVLKRIACELLTDPVNEDFSLKKREEKGVKITIFFKPGVLDIEGKRILEALKIMGIKGISEAHRGKRYIINTSRHLPPATYRFIAEKLLYNKVIEKAEIKMSGSAKLKGLRII